MAGRGLQLFPPPGLTHQLMIPNLALPPGSSAAAQSWEIASGFNQSPGSDVGPAPSAGRGDLEDGPPLPRRVNPSAAAGFRGVALARDPQALA